MTKLILKITQSLKDRLPSLLKTEKDKFDFFMNLKGEYFRKQKGRETILIVIPSVPITLAQAGMTVNEKSGDDSYGGGLRCFIKKHAGIGIIETLKNFIMLKEPVYGARNEWLALNRLKAHHVPAPEPFAFGEKGCCPIFQSSFIVMQAIEDSTSLEDVCRDWKKKSPHVAFKRALIKEVARISRKMHKLGVNHRDYYICHFLFKSRSELKPVLHLIDLHRAQIRKKVPFRWLCKDLAGLYFSSMDIGLTKRDIIYFLKEYFLMSWREILICHGDLLDKVNRRAVKLYMKH